MSINLIAMLVSLAMLLTGAGVDGQPAQASRVATLSNVVVTYNGESVNLTPEAHLGVQTDGARALFDFGVQQGDNARLPVQLSVDEAGVTALFAESGEAVTVTAQALEGLVAQYIPAGNGGESELMTYITGEYLPAYTAALKALSDPEAQAALREDMQAIFEERVDRGEGTPDTIEDGDERYDVTLYTYTLDGAKLGELLDALYSGTPVLSDYYDATFRLYGLLPEATGLAGIDSYTALMERTGLDMTMDVEERLSEDGEIDVTDATLTLSMAAPAIQEIEAEEETFADAEAEFAAEEAVEEIEDTAAEAIEAIEPEGDAEEAIEAIEPEGDAEDAVEAIEPEGDAEEAVEAIEPEGDAEEAVEAIEPEGDDEDAPEPIVILLHTEAFGDVVSSEATCDYDAPDGEGVQMVVASYQEEGAQEMELDMTLLEDGAKTARVKASGFLAQDDEAGSSYGMNLRCVSQDAFRVDANLYGMGAEDGSSQNSVSFALRTSENSYRGSENIGLSFDLNVTGEAVEDQVSGIDDAYVIDDLTGDLTADPTLAALMMKIGGSLSVDVARLANDTGVSRLIGLVKGEGLPIDVDDLDDEEQLELSFDDEGDGDYEIVMDEDDGLVLEDSEPVEDDGALAFAQPILGWLPQGWKVATTDVDTAYDWVEMSIVDGDGAECAYAVFFADPEPGSVNYIIRDNGELVEGREVNISDYGEGGLSVTVRENGVYANLMLVSGAIDIDTITRIATGIRF